MTKDAATTDSSLTARDILNPSTSGVDDDHCSTRTAVVDLFEKKQPEDKQRPSPLLNLPESVLGEVLEYLPLADRFHTLQTSNAMLWSHRVRFIQLFRNVKCPAPTTATSDDDVSFDEDAGETPPLNGTISTAFELRWLQHDMHHFISLRSLDLGPLCTDEFLMSLMPTQLQTMERQRELEQTNDQASGRNFDHPALHNNNKTISSYYHNNHFTQEMVGECFLSQLEEISLVRSEKVTDKGLWALAQGDRGRTLTRVDITFCKNTTYHGTFPLRDTCPNLKELRRQPKWMDGQFLTPFEGDGFHVYWCDGSFRFARDQQSSGYVCSLEELRPGWEHEEGDDDKIGRHRYYPRVCDKLQYNNFDPPTGWPEWSRYCYRPGVSLLNLDLENDKKTSDLPESPKGQQQRRRQVLVAQRLYGLRPPKDYPTLEMRDWMGPGESRYLNRRGRRLSTPRTAASHDNNHHHNGDDDNDEEDQDHNDELHDRFIMITKMEVYPLETLMPPKDLVEANREFCVQLQDSAEDRFLEGGEAFLHHALDRE